MVSKEENDTVIMDETIDFSVLSGLTSAQPLGLKYSELTINLCACGDGGMAANMSHCKGVNY